MRRALVIVALLLVPAIAGCAPDAVTLQLVFPTEDSFVQSNQARVLAFPVDESTLGVCPELVNGLASSRFPLEPVYDSTRIDVCAFRGGMSLPELRGPHAYLVEVRDQTQLILQGCAIGEVFDGAGVIDVALQPTPMYFTSPPATGTLDSRCAGAE